MPSTRARSSGWPLWLSLVLASLGCDGGSGGLSESLGDAGDTDAGEGEPVSSRGSSPESVETVWQLVDHPRLSFSPHTLASEDGYRRNVVDCVVSTNTVTIHLIDSGYEANDHLARAPSELTIELDRYDATHCSVDLDEGGYGQPINTWSLYRDQCGGAGGCEVDLEVVEHGSVDDRTFEIMGTFQCTQMLGGADGPTAALVGTVDPTTLETQPGTLHLRGCLPPR